MSKNNGTKNIWKSIKEYQEDPEVLQTKLDEFQYGVTDDFHPDEMNKFSRRKFLAVLAASTAYAATACTNYRDKGEIVPYVDRPEEILPGKPTFYASTFSEDGISYGILVKTREGRPIKIDGNPDDPINKGKIPSRIHSSILNLYDPERLQAPSIGNRMTSWNKIIEELHSQLSKHNLSGKEIAIISGPLTSPTTKKVINDFTEKFSATKLYGIHLANDANRRTAWKNSFNQDYIPSIKWNEANIIVALESDFLGKDGNTVENRRLYAEGRNVAETNELSKLYSFETGMSLTGMNSDMRFRLKPQMQFDLVLSLMGELIKKGFIDKSKVDANVINLVKSTSIQKFADKSGLSEDKLSELVSELGKNKGKSIIFAGDVLPVETQAIINLLNELLENSSLYDFEKAYLKNGNLSSSDEITDLVERMKNGDIGAIIHFDSNPVYELASGFGYKDALEKVETVVSLSEVPNETTHVSNYILPLNNILESWGDHQTRNGHLTLQQPVINPLFDSLQKETILLNFVNGGVTEDDSYHKYLKSSIKETIYDKLNSASGFESFWMAALHDGVISTDSQNSELGKVDQSIISKPLLSSNGMTLVIQNNYSIGTGKYSNNGWLQELPHPVSKIAWDNYAALAPATASNLDIENDDIIKITIDGKELEIPAFVQPGMSEETIVVELGYGRTNSGEVADEVGFNVSGLLDAGDISKFIFDNVSVTKTGGIYKLASTQEHHSLDEEFVKDFHRSRNIIQEGTLEKYLNNPEFLNEYKHDVFSITESHEYKDEKWAMTIDLNKCLGCSECISSCNVENNVPIVGKDQVSRGREMHWIRLDRYYSGTPEEPIVSTQPILCQHCDNAPCENVCPVNATNHSPDGLNQMAYNRCVGTRYCVNNCPYKVRRFNFYNFRDSFADAHYDNDLTSLVHNPEVTVRSRGVIEKCTFCVQNIMEARENAIREGRELGPEDVQTSCQTACPTNAIEFGDSNNKDTKVSKNRANELSYHVLEDLNIRPNVTYLAKIRNTHSEDV